ncbi:MAG TPA: YidC/Oxa1 family membrane protein insertase [Acidimicrobiales bacterium]|nr:YidC/Oxa1 family membrane protein insertase [Acidimicrobiales bacterium]
MLAENALFKSIGTLFHPVFLLFGWILAGIYSVIPNYAVAITGLTVVIMLALTPVTVKSTKSMLAMQRLQPEMKKLQAKYKGAENREQLNQEMMKLYKENGTSPFGACLPSLLQMPFLIILYSLIRGLSNQVKDKAGHLIAQPRYIPTFSRIHQDLVATNGHMAGPFGMDLSARPIAHHGANQAVLIIPYLVLIGAAMFLQYYQMKQMNSRNPQAAAANPQMQAMQKFFPIIFGVIYINVPTGAIIYMVVSSAMRIATQEVMFRTGMVTPVTHEREIGATSKPSTGGGGSGAKAKPAVTKAKAVPEDGSKDATPTPLPPKSSGGGNGNRAGNGRKAAARGQSANGRKAAGQSGEAPAAPPPKEHPRSRSKRARKSR